MSTLTFPNYPVIPTKVAVFDGRRKLRDYGTQPEWLQWFRNNVNLGEDQERQIEFYRKEFELETGKLCPEKS